MSLEPTAATPSQPNRRSAFALPLRLFFVVALLLSTFGGAFGTLTPGASAATTTFTVNSTDDAVDATPGDGTCATSTNVCTLRAAIQEANALAALTPADTYVITLTAGTTYVLTLYNLAPINEDDAATGDLDIKASLTITGNGATIQGTTNAPASDKQDRVFQVFGGYTSVFNDLTIEDGYAYQSNGGGILHDGGEDTGGTLTLNNVTVTDNDTGQPSSSQDNPGAGIYNGVGRTLTLNVSTVSNNGKNTTTQPGDGGGIYNAGTLTVQGNSVVSGNLGGDGGGVYNAGTATITDTIIRSNVAGKTNGSSFPFTSQPFGNGGGIYNATGGTLGLTNTTIATNGAAIGGGIANLSNGLTPARAGVRAAVTPTPGVAITGGTIANNTAIVCGGGIANGVDFFDSGTNNDSLTVTRTTIQNNAATGGTVGIIIFASSTLGGLGGGICNAGTATISQATIAANNAASIGTQNEEQTGLGGGIGNIGTLSVDNSALVGNSVSGPGNGGAIANGAIERFQEIDEIARPSDGPRIASVDTQLTVTNSTISGNSAPNGGGALFNVDDSTATLINVTIANNTTGILNSQDINEPQNTRASAQAATLTVQNSIVANNSGYNCSGTIANGGYNIDSDSPATCAFGTTGSSLSGIDPQLSPLALNAPGTTQTHALAVTSAAIDKIPATGANCPTTDQRGVTRPQGAACDIGAYELIPVASPSPSPSASPSPSPSPSPVPGNYTVALSITGSGTVNPGPGTATYPAGSTQTYTATPAANNVLLGWTVDGTFVGFGNPLNLPVTKNRTVVAAFAPIPAFCDVTTATANYTAITQLAARGVIFGSDNPNGAGKCFNGGEYLARIHVAGFVARLFGWANEDHGNTFTDKGAVDDDLWRNAGTLAFYDVARGYRDGTYDPTGNVLHAQAVSFVTRAMIRKGYWTIQNDNGTYYTAVPTASGHRQDAVTFYTYAGNIPGTGAPTDPWGGPDGYAGQSSRNYFVNVLWQAYSSYFSTNHIP